MAFQLVSAQTSDKKWSVGLIAGKNEYNGDLGNGICKFNKASYNFGEISIYRYVTKSFDLGVQGSYGDYGYYKNGYENFLLRKSQGSIMLKYKLANGYILKETAKLTPFISLGIGLASYKGTRTNKLGNTTPENNAIGNDMVTPIGAGLQYKLNDNLALQYKVIYNVTNKDIRDGFAEKENDSFVEQSVGLIISFKKIECKVVF